MTHFDKMLQVMHSMPDHYRPIFTQAIKKVPEDLKVRPVGDVAKQMKMFAYIVKKVVGREDIDYKASHPYIYELMEAIYKWIDSIR